MIDYELEAKMGLVEWVVEVLHSYMFDPDETRAVIHLEFEKGNGERQVKERWYVKSGYKRNGDVGVDGFSLKNGEEVARTRHYDSFLDNPDQIF